MLRDLSNFDIYGKNEEKILLCFRDDAIGCLNLLTKDFTVIASPLSGGLGDANERVVSVVE